MESTRATKHRERLVRKRSMELWDALQMIRALAAHTGQKNIVRKANAVLLPIETEVWRKEANRRA